MVVDMANSNRLSSSGGYGGSSRDLVPHGTYCHLWDDLSCFADPHDPEIRRALMALGAPDGPMNADVDGNVSTPKKDVVTLPAGFTYLGQFIAHDLTLEAKTLPGNRRDPAKTSNFSTPLLDLGHIYGDGPGPDSQDRELYREVDGGYEFRVGRMAGATPGLTVAENDTRVRCSPDLFRREDPPHNFSEAPWDGKGPPPARVPDVRNDINTIIAQLTVAFQLFHNAVSRDGVFKNVSNPVERFEEVRGLVRKYYQWIVLNQYLRRIVGESIWSDVTQSGGRGPIFYQAQAPVHLPVEFTAAAFRFGHAQVRSVYTLNLVGGEPPPFFQTPILGDEPETSLAGRSRVPGRFVEWDRFFYMGGPLQDWTNAPHVNMSRRIAPYLVGSLLNMPTHLLDDAESVQTAVGSQTVTLAQRDLLRHFTFGIPSGQAIAKRMKCNMPEITVLEEEQFPQLLKPNLRCLASSTPLWYYVLQEADLLGDPQEDRSSSSTDNGAPSDDPGINQTLGPVGGRLVAEVIYSVLKADPDSIVNQPEWRPSLACNGRFGMNELLRYADVHP
jgi:hypothetical protein